MEDNIVTLDETIPAFALFYNSGPNAWVPTVSDNIANGWINVDGLRGSSIQANRVWAFQAEIDVSGWGNQGLTFYPLQAGIQEGNTWTYIVDDFLEVIDLISDSPLDLAAFCQHNLLSLPYKTVPGLYQDYPSDNFVFDQKPPLGFENILYGEKRTFAYNSNLPTSGGVPTVLPINTNPFGSMNPTATDKLYVTRILVMNNASQTQGFMNCPSTRFIIKGQLKRESDLSYIFRLKDSFKTTQTDVGYGRL